MKIKRLLFLTTIYCSVAHAHNNLFFPSDAYFSSAVTQEFMEEIKVSDDVSISYKRYANSFMMCGYAGYWNAELRDLPESVRDNLKVTLSELFKNENEKAITVDYEGETAFYFPLLIYNKDFDFDQYPICLKFNENSELEQLEKAKRGHFVDDRIRSEKLRAFDNEHSTEVRALDVKKRPRNFKDFMGVKKPIIINASEIVFVVLLNSKEGDLVDHAQQKAGTEFLLIGESIQRIKNR